MGRNRPEHREQVISSVIHVLALLILCPGVCHAAGDPALVYFFIGNGMLHVGLGLILLISRRFERGRILLLGIYICSLVVTWMWALDYRGPVFSKMYIGLSICPIIAFIFVMFIRSAIHKKN